tara:strand:- start:4564 stop:5523 length:960 start_codon:yes stop_codon:yes gene_type:complete
MSEPEQVAPETAEPSPPAPTEPTLMDEVTSLLDSTTVGDESTGQQVVPEEEPDTAEPEPEASESEDEPEESGAEPEEDPFNKSKGVQKRISKLVDARKKAEAERDEALEELEQARQQPVQKRQDADSPLSEVSSHADLQTFESNVKTLHYWLIENPEGGTYKDASGQEHEIPYEQARKLQVSTSKDISDNIPKRRSQIDHRTQATTQAVKTFPWMKDAKSNEYNKVVEFLAADPALNDLYQKSPIGPLLVGYLIEGTKVIQSRKSKSTTPAKAPSIPGPAATESRVQKSSSNKQTTALHERALNSGTQGDVANYLESLL